MHDTNLGTLSCDPKTVDRQPLAPFTGTVDPVAGTADGPVVCACGMAGPVGARYCAVCGRFLARIVGDGGSAPQESGAAPALPRRPAEERRTVTALFADLSGFTSLAGRLDAEELLAVIDPVVAGLAAIVERYGGYLEKFAGDALLALFGAPVAHEDDALRALQVAIEMHNRVAELGGDTELTLHIGVNTGTVVARSIEAAGLGQYAALGTPVILAQRLQSMAGPGQTFVGELTAQLTRHQFDYDELGPQQAKGLTDPLQVYRLAGRRKGAPRRDTTRMVGRSAELASAYSSLSEPATPSSAAVHIEGPAGSGKSRLLAELRLLLEGDGVRCVEIAGTSYATAAYRCFEPLIAEALRLRYPDEDGPAARLRRLDDDPAAPDNALYTGLLMGLTVAERALEREPPAVPGRLHDAAARWLVDLQRSGPVVVLVDNYQWLDASSRNLLDALIGTATTAAVAFCSAGRPPDRPAAGAVLELGPLGNADIEQLVADELGLAPEHRLVEFVAERTQGNPLMVRETVGQLRTEALLDERAGHARLVAGTATISLPTTLRALLAARVDALPGTLIDAATAASAIGTRVPVALLAGIADEPADAVRELSERHVLHPSGPDELRFDSTLLRDVLYTRLTARRRRALHSRIADVLESAFGTADSGVAQLAEHRYLAGDHRRALPLLRAAATQARAVNAADQAVVALTRALEAAREVAPNDVPELLCDLADLRMDLGEYQRAADLFADSAAAVSSARAWAGLAATLRRRGDYADGQKVLQQAFEGEPAGDLRLLWCELSWNLSVSGDLTGSLDAARNGLALGGDDQVAGLLLSQLVRAETLHGDFALAHEHADAAIRALAAAQNASGLSTALRLLGALHEREGELELAAASLERGLSLAERTGLVEEIGGCLVNLGMVRGAMSDHAAAAACYARAESVFESVGHRAGQAVSYGNHAYELLQLGESQDGRRLAERGLAIADEVGNHYFAADIHHTLALIAESTRDFAEARRHAASAIDEFDLAGMPDYAEPSRELIERVAAAGG